MPRADTQALNAHLAEIASTVEPGTHALVMLDQAGLLGKRGQSRRYSRRAVSVQGICGSVQLCSRTDSQTLATAQLFLGQTLRPKFRDIRITGEDFESLRDSPSKTPGRKSLGTLSLTL